MRVMHPPVIVRTYQDKTREQAARKFERDARGAGPRRLFGRVGVDQPRDNGPVLVGLACRQGVDDRHLRPPATTEDRGGARAPGKPLPARVWRETASATSPATSRAIRPRRRYRRPTLGGLERVHSPGSARPPRRGALPGRRAGGARRAGLGRDGVDHAPARPRHQRSRRTPSVPRRRTGRRWSSRPREAGVRTQNAVHAPVRPSRSRHVAGCPGPAPAAPSCTVPGSLHRRRERRSSRWPTSATRGAGLPEVFVGQLGTSARAWSSPVRVFDQPDYGHADPRIKERASEQERSWSRRMRPRRCRSESDAGLPGGRRPPRLPAAAGTHGS